MGKSCYVKCDNKHNATKKTGQPIYNEIQHTHHYNLNNHQRNDFMTYLLKNKWDFFLVMMQLNHGGAGDGRYVLALTGISWLLLNHRQEG
jgi:hypothetical protein